MGIQKWLWKIAAKKVVVRLVQFLVSWIAASKLQSAGVTVDAVKLTAAVLAGSEVLRTYLKVKFGLNWL